MDDHRPFPRPSLIPVNGVELEVYEAGQRSDALPIVLCHGWPEHAYCWRFLMPQLAEAGYHVIAPNQRGYGNSACPQEVTDYGLDHLTGDLSALLDHFGYQEAIFIGHDWGAFVVWGMAMLHPEKVSGLVALSMPYLERGNIPWIDFLEQILGPDHYMVHFNRQPGVADAILDKNRERFLRNLFRKALPEAAPAPGVVMIALAQAEVPLGEPVMSETDLAVFADAFQTTGFTPSLNWYRNLNQNWHLLGEVDPIVRQPALMIYGDKDPVQQTANLEQFVPKVEVVTLESGHWIQQERPGETAETILTWLQKQIGR